MEVIAGFYTSYLRAIQEASRGLPPETGDVAFKKLSSMDGLLTVLTIWKMSEFAEPYVDRLGAGLSSDEALSQAPLTPTSIGLGSWRRLADPEESQEKHIVSARRIVEAAIVFGLVERDAERANLRPIKATAKLDELIQSFAADYVRLFRG